ncbi:hypothetical protein PAMP_008659 [Pampus punctatissimus]
MGENGSLLESHFPMKWGLSESGLMAEGVVLLCWEHYSGDTCFKLDLSPAVNPLYAPFLSVSGSGVVPPDKIGESARENVVRVSVWMARFVPIPSCRG